MKFRHKAAHLFLETIHTVKTSFHFHVVVASLETNYFFCHFLKCVVAAAYHYIFPPDAEIAG